MRWNRVSTLAWQSRYVLCLACNPFIHRNSDGLWLRFTTYGAEGQPYVTLLPEYHLAEQAFHFETKNHGLLSTVFMYEGAGLGGWTRWVYSRAVNTLGRRTSLWESSGRRRGLRPQKDAPGKVCFRQLSVPISEGCVVTHDVKFVRADLNVRELMHEWRKLETSTRLKTTGFLFALPFLLPVIMLAIRRKDFVEASECSCDEPDKFWGLEPLLLDAREREIFKALDPELEDLTDEHSIAIRYGAGHMPAVAEWLESRGYRQTGSRFVLAIKAKRDAHCPAECGHGVALESWCEDQRERHAETVADTPETFSVSTQNVVGWQPTEASGPYAVSVANWNTGWTASG